jgi:hypothetical protein
MRTLKHALVVMMAALLIAWAIPALAQQVPAQQTAAQQESVARGELVRVDAKAKTIEIRAGQAAPMRFSYNDATKVTGAEEGLAGLATMAGSQLTVHYSKQEQNNVATWIEVQKKA